MNVHNPVRAENETQADYRMRRSASKRIGQHITLSGRHLPGGTNARESHRDAMRGSGAMKKHAGHYGSFLRDWITGKNLAAMRYGH